MDDIDSQRNEEQIAELLAEELTGMGFSACSEDTGGGICCVVMQRNAGGQIVWGTADFTWGATVENADGEIESSLETNCPSDTLDIKKIAQALKSPSITAGATFEPGE